MPRAESRICLRTKNANEERCWKKAPCHEGYGIETGWNTRIIQHVLEKKFSVTMSRGGICDMLHRWGFRYTRPA
ncbi:winged helix-turn-helix domain-containing protein [Parageobacillus thermoglucosidasius]